MALVTSGILSTNAATLKAKPLSNRSFQIKETKGIFRSPRIYTRIRSANGDPERKEVLDAFFLGKAVAETLNEKLGEALGEFISVVSQRQAEQREAVKQIQDEIQERAQIALLRAAKEALSKSKPTSED